MPRDKTGSIGKTVNGKLGLKPIRLLLVSSSPRQNGNSMFLASELQKYTADMPFLTESVLYGLGGRKIEACMGCLFCYKNGGRCIINDNFEELRQLWLNSDAIMYIFPVYHAGIPGQLKCFMDRLGNSMYGYSDIASLRHMKVIGALSQGGVPMGGQEISNQFIMAHAALMHSLYVTGDGSHMGAGLISGKGGNRNSFMEKIDAGECSILEDLANIRNMMRRMVETAAIVNAGIICLREKLSLDACYSSCSRPLTNC